MSGRTEPSSHATFNIGSQQGTINNVGHDMNVDRPTSYVSFGVVDPAIELERLRRELHNLAVPSPTRRFVADALTDIEREVAKPVPEKGTVARRLEDVVSALRAAGATVSAGASIVEPLARLARWLGPLGVSIAALL